MTRGLQAGAANGYTQQSRIVAFLSAAGTIDAAPAKVFRTHAAIVFVGATRALKIKRAVKLPYLDFSTLERRRAACLHEIEVNRTAASDIYLGVVPIIERTGGGLAIGGPGTPLEWAVEMRAFDQADLLSERAAAGLLPPALLTALADAVATAHERAQIRTGTDAVAKMSSIVRDVTVAARASASDGLATRIDAVRLAAETALARAEPVLVARAAAGCVRRCHGDLHLANIVVWDGRPTPFDAIEFDDEIATVDTLYDLAFLLMDLDRRSGRAAANIVLNRYLWRTGSIADLVGLAALPLFLGMRAAIRALVAEDRARLQADDAACAQSATIEAADYLDRALRYLVPAKPSLIAVGGLSGSGKSTLARALAPAVGPAPGAVLLRSDLERKALAGVAETERLAKESYTQAASDRVYARLFDRAAAALSAGHGVIADAVFLKSTERARLREIAKLAGVPFLGLWLDAPAAALAARVTDRTGDASDATVEVVGRQLAEDAGAIDWHRIDASRTIEETLEAAFAVARTMLPLCS
ncbi:MAG: AAA family ATPase [Hyphomicrobiaceae bacterium]|nr:AAA family ATPase [Hyphomicrobiaceae bacterium]